MERICSKRDECGPCRAAVCKSVWMLVCKLVRHLACFGMLYRDVILRTVDVIRDVMILCCGCYIGMLSRNKPLRSE